MPSEDKCPVSESMITSGVSISAESVSCPFVVRRFNSWGTASCYANPYTQIIRIMESDNNILLFVSTNIQGLGTCGSHTWVCE